jgi:hypothetical protein
MSLVQKSFLCALCVSAVQIFTAETQRTQREEFEFCTKP